MSSVSATSIIRDLDTALGRRGVATTADIRAVRVALSKRLVSEGHDVIFAVASALLKRDRDYDRFIAYELIANHREARAKLSATRLRELGAGMDSWGDVDTFACYLSGVAWREGQISDDEVRRWSRSPNRWWRRAALVSTVPLNLTARGGAGDSRRTLAACDWLIADRDPMVVKALSWALRSLIPRDAAAVRAYVERVGDRLPALARREVRTKLVTGLKNPRRKKPSA